MKNFLKGTSLFLSSLLFLTVSFSSSSAKPVDAAINSASITNIKEDINIISSDFDNLVYTYTENGKEFKVIESLNENLTEVSSEVFVKNEEGNYELQSEIDATVSNNAITIETAVQNEASVEVIELGSVIKSTPSINLKSEVSQKLDPLGTIVENGLNDQIKPFAIIEDNGLTEWRYAGVLTGSNFVLKLTLGAIVAVLAGVAIPAMAVTAGVTLGAGAKITIIYIANNIFSNSFATVYYIQTTYYKYLIGTNPLLPRAEKTYTTVYSNKALTNKISDTVIAEYWD